MKNPKPPIAVQGCALAHIGRAAEEMAAGTSEEALRELREVREILSGAAPAGSMP